VSRRGSRIFFGITHLLDGENKDFLLTARTLALAKVITEEAVTNPFIIEELCEVYKWGGGGPVDPVTISSERLGAIGTEISERIVGLNSILAIE
jgi:hypothetical protein